MRWLSGIRPIVLVTTAGCNPPAAPSSLPPTPLKLTLASDAWQTISEPNPIALGNADGALTFDFPATGSVNYIYTASPFPAVRGTLEVTLRVSTTGPVVFHSLDTGVCNIPTAVRPFIWSNDNGNGSYDRWWSNPNSYTLASGANVISVPLRAANWSSVNGKIGSENSETKYGFEKALLNVTRFGLTFGGGCSFGHGVNATGGRAQFVLTDYSVK
jgi:hypothetical protein